MATEIVLEEFLPYRISRLAERASRSLAQVYEQRFAISVPEWRVLATLAERPGLTASAVTGLTNLDKVKVSRAVSQLVDRGLLTRRASRSDRRAAELRLSAAGQRLFASIAPLAAAWESCLLKVLSDTERALLFELLTRVEERLPLAAAAMQDSSPGSTSAVSTVNEHSEVSQ